MGLINSIGAYFEKVTGGFTFGTQTFKATIKGVFSLISTTGARQYTLQDRNGTLAMLDDLESNYEIVSLTAHGFTVGKCLKKGSTASAWSLIDGTVNTDDEFRGIVISVPDANTFLVAFPGSRVRGLSGLTAGSLHYAQADGSLSTVATQIKALFADTATSGYVIQSNSGASVAGTKASVSEINTGTNDIKFATPLGLQGSKYLDNTLSKIFASTSGGDNYTVTFSPAITSLTANTFYFVKFVNANTGPSTLNPNGLGDKDILKNVSQPLDVNDLPGNQITLLYYNGTAFEIVGFFGFGRETKKLSSGRLISFASGAWMEVCTTELSSNGSFSCLITVVGKRVSDNTMASAIATAQGKRISGTISIVGNVVFLKTFTSGSDTLYQGTVVSLRVQVLSNKISVQIRQSIADTTSWYITNEVMYN